MTSNQISARANQIAEEKNKLTEEMNSIQSEYNQMYMAEFTRHNQSMESIDAEKNRIQDRWNSQSLALTSEKQANDVRIAELGLSLQYANESQKRDLESERLQLDRDNQVLTREYNNALAEYNRQMAQVSQEKNDIQSAYNDAMVEVANRENDIKALNAEITALNAANQVIIANMNNQTSRWAATLNFLSNADKNRTERRGQDINSETQRRGQNLSYDLGTQNLSESQRHNVVTEVEQGVQTVGNIVVGRSGLLSWLSPTGIIKNSTSEARKAWDNLWR